LIGDRRVGKRTLALQAALSAANRGEIVVFCMIGQTLSDIRSVYQYFVQHNILDNVVMIVSSAHDSPYLIFRAPYSAMVHAEYFRDKGKDVLVVFDDLSTHAQFYRELSLLAERFPGRDSYPGDIFYVHSNLLERAGNFKSDDGNEVSITCLPLVHIHESDLTSYIATNSIGITDGHLFLDRDLLLRGVRPPINLGLSVTRAGKQTQSLFLRDMNKVVSRFLAHYEDLHSYAQFGSELNPAISEQIALGDLMHRYFEQMSMGVVPLVLDVLILSLIWNKTITGNSSVDYATLTSRLTAAYELPDNKPFFESIMSYSSFGELLEFISTHQEMIKNLCGLET